jgi:hypothetical protein
MAAGLATPGAPSAWGARGRIEVARGVDAKLRRPAARRTERIA